MKVYKTQNEIEKDIKNGVLAIEGDVMFECPISISAKIVVTAGNITAGNITAGNITAGNITARDITAGNINAGNINALDINALDINAGNINALDINAGNILYHAFCCVYQGIKCLSIKAKRDVHQEPICLDGKLEIINKETETIKIGEYTYNKDEVETALKDLKAI